MSDRSGTENIHRLLMGVVEKNLRVSMICEGLEQVPSFSLPGGFSMRSYIPGDEALWVEVYSAAEKYLTINLELFRKEFGGDPEPLSKRQLFLMDPAGLCVGTATAWFNDDYYGRPIGRIHWVAIRPEFQGRGLSKPLMGAACARLRELGHRAAYLVTSTGRVPAINLYLSLGFAPDIRSPEDEQIWAELKPFLKWPRKQS